MGPEVSDYNKRHIFYIRDSVKRWALLFNSLSNEKYNIVPGLKDTFTFTTSRSYNILF